jgi:TM2 domain-containing membrane protein YozV
MKNSAKSYTPIISAILSIIPGFGQIYLHKFFKGFVLILSFCLSVVIIWLAVSHKEFKLFDWDGKHVMFNPYMKSVYLFGRNYQVTEIMKVTGPIQLIITWIFSIVDAILEGRRAR